MQPIILYENVLKTAFPAESREAKLANELLLDVYSNPTKISLDVILPQPTEIDSLGIILHNLSSLKLEVSTDGTSYQTIYEAKPESVDFVRFTPILGNIFKLTLTPPDNTTLVVGNLFLGKCITLDYGFTNFTPANLIFSDKVFTSTNYQNIALSNVVQKQTRKIKITQEYIKSEVFEEKFRNFLSKINTNHFYLDYFDRCYCILDKGSTINTSIKNNLINFNFDASILTKEDFN